MYAEDFVKWCADCVRIYDKMTGASVPFVLNAPQRRVAHLMEERRLAGKPVRILLLKARQWGGSTLTQVYMAWMQLVRHRAWHSLICSHVKDSAGNIRGMYSHLLASYPEDMMQGEDRKRWQFVPYEKSANVCCIPARDCRIALTSAFAPNAARGSAFQMAHLSEVAFWGDGDKEVASRIVRTVCGSVPYAPETVIVLESTADGKENYFYDEWQRAVAGKSDKIPVFVPWHEIEIYRLRLTESERAEYPARFDDYELMLLHRKGLDVEQVAWYHEKRAEYPRHEDMMAEYPTTSDEAFSTSRRSWPGAALVKEAQADAPGPALAAAVIFHSHAAGATVACSDGRGLTEQRTVAVTEAADLLRRSGLSTVALLEADSDISARWLTGYLAEAGVRLTADADDLELRPVTPAVAQDLESALIDAMRCGRWHERDASEAARLRGLSETDALRDAGLLLRGALCPRPAAPLSAADFL